MGGGVITRMVWKIVPEASSVVICVQQDPLPPLYRMSPGISGGSGRAIQQGHIEYQCGKTGGDYLPSMSYGTPKIGGGVQAEDDGRRPVVLVPPKV